MTTDHLRPLLEHTRDLHSFFKVGELLSRGRIPPDTARTIRRGRVTALSKDGSGVRGIVAGEVIRRVTARTTAQQLGEAVERFTDPFQHALSTRAGCECIVHLLQTLTELDPEALGQHPALEPIKRRCPEHTVMAFLDDINLVSKPQRVRAGYSSVEQELWRHAKIRVHKGKTHIWNLAGTKPDICEELQRLAEAAKPGARVWRGSEVPTEEQGIRVLGAHVGHRDFIRRHLEKVLEQHQVLLNGIPRVPDVQSAWLILLHCASARANYQLRVMRPEVVLEFAAAHDENLWRGLCAILDVATTACTRNARDTSSLPLSLGGLVLRSAIRTRVSACWASWADTLPMVRSRHPRIADIMVCHSEGVTQSPCLGAASNAAAEFPSSLRWQMVCAHLRESLSFTTRVPPEQAGNTKQQSVWKGDSGQPRCSQEWRQLRGPWFGRKQGLMLVWLCQNALLPR